MRKLSAISGFLFFILFFTIASAEVDPREGDRQLLRGILADVEKSLNNKDFSLVLKHLHPDAVVTYYNAEVTRNHAEAEAYFQRMIVDTNAVVKEFTTVASIGAPALFYGNTAVAWGTTAETYTLATGLEFRLDGNWTVTLQKTDDQWKIIALHFSTNLFDNPLLNNAKRFSWIVGVVAFLSGLLVMFVIGRFFRK